EEGSGRPKRPAISSPAGIGNQTSTNTRSTRSVAATEIGVLLVTLPFCAVWATVLWLRLKGERPAFGLPPEIGRLVTLVWWVGVPALVWNAALGYVRCRRMNADEAWLLLQDALWQETRREKGEWG